MMEAFTGILCTSVFIFNVGVKKNITYAYERATSR